MRIERVARLGLVLGWMVGGCVPSESGVQEAPAPAGTRRAALASSAEVGEPVLLADIAPVPSGAPTLGSGATDLFAAGNNLFLTASEGEGLTQVWAYKDGRPGGAFAIDPALVSPYLQNTTRIAVGNTLFWLSSLDVARSDGTAEGTVKLDRNAYRYVPGARTAQRMGDTLFLTLARMPSYDVELWRYDEGVGLRQVADLYPSTTASVPDNLEAVAGTLFFTATDVRGRGLWTSDGTAAGTRWVKAMPTRIEQTMAVGPLFFFNQGRELWRSDGTAAGTFQVKPASSASQAALAQWTVVGNRLFFLQGAELWRSDGTVEGTLQVRAASAYESPPYWLTAVGDTLFFAADDAQAGRELWASDGLPQGTRQVKDILPGYGTSNLTQLRAVGNVLFLLAKEASNLPYQLWRSDGTAEGTQRLTQFPLGAGSDALLSAGGRVYVAERLAAGRARLWRADASGAPLVELANFTSISLGTATDKSFGDVLYFVANDGVSGVETWRTDGTPAGTRLLVDVNTDIPGDGSAPRFGARVGNALVFGTSLQGLWKSNGTSVGTVLVSDQVQMASGPLFASRPGQMFFVGSDSKNSNDLFRTDGTSAGTAFVKEASLQGMATLGDQLLLNNSQAATGYEPWVSDGTASGTVLLKDIHPSGSGLEAGDTFVVVGPFAYFVANDGTSGRELWRTDGTSAGTVQVADLVPGATGSKPIGLTAHAGALFFLAEVPSGTSSVQRALYSVDASGIVRQRGAPGSFMEPLISGGSRLFFFGNEGRELWTHDETQGTTRVAPGLNVSSPRAAAWNGEVLLFQASSAAAGRELWRSDGTTQGTRLLKDLAPGVAHGMADSKPLALPDLGLVLFQGSNGTQGFEPWVTDGTEAGTRMLKDVWPGHRSSFPSGFTRMGNRVFFQAHDGTHGVEPWVVSLPASPLDAPPVVTCPSPVVAEAQSAQGAVVTFPSATATDDLTAAVPVSHHPASGALFALGTTRVTASAVDESGNVGTCAFDVVVRDTTAPQVTCPARVLAEATDVAGARVDYARATATDAVTAASALVVDASPAPGELFPQGVSTVTVTARDAAGNTGQCSFEVLVRDTQPPVLTCSSNRSAEATSPEGARVTYPAARAEDRASAVTLTYSPASGAMFPVGLNSVDVRARDTAGNEALCSFTVVVRDTTPPQVTCPASFSVEAVNDQGAPVTFAATATDAVTVSPTVTYSAAPGSWFAVGSRLVRAWARDAARNESDCAFDVVVRDTTPPVLTCPTEVVVEALSARGAVASFSVGARDTVSAATVTYSHAPGGTFPLGTTLVTATGQDNWGNQATCAFPVRVRDTTPPALQCQGPMTLEATSAAGALFTAPARTAVDTVSAEVPVVYHPAPGTALPLGTTPVVLSATDAAGNTATCTSSVQVRDTTPPVLTCPVSVVAEATSPQGAVVDYAVGVLEAVTAAPSMTYSKAPGATFALGTTTVTVSARDAAGNAGTCSFPVTVKDTTAPTLLCPGDRTVEATSGAGAVVAYGAIAVSDNVSAVTPTASPASGSQLPLGTTRVTVTARDAANNTSTCAFTVTVRDTTPPALTCPASVTAEATSATGTLVDYGAATATDAVSAVSLAYDRASGGRFGLGTTAVGVTARDAAGNVSTCAFDVTVRDTTPPVLTCPGNLTREAESAEGTAVGFTVTVRDAASSRLMPSYSHAPGSVFPVGQTRVRVSARDPSGNTGLCSFLVTVEDERRALR